jgi:hypothetical protein
MIKSYLEISQKRRRNLHISTESRKISQRLQKLQKVILIMGPICSFSDKWQKSDPPT